MREVYRTIRISQVVRPPTADHPDADCDPPVTLQ